MTDFHERPLQVQIDLLALEMAVYMWQVHVKLLALEKNFNPNQPRVSAGSPGGGQWTSDGASNGGGSLSDAGNTVNGHRVYSPSSVPRSGNGNTKPLNTNIAVQSLHDNLSPKEFGNRNCALNVANAIRASGISIVVPPVRTTEGANGPWAKDYGLSLAAAGFSPVAKNGPSGIYPPVDYTPQKGDVVVIQSIPHHPAGHMAMFDGAQWVSDFKQKRGIWPGKDYEQTAPDYTIYRHGHRI